MNPILQSGGDLIHSEFASDPDFEEVLGMFLESLPEKRDRMVAEFQAGQIDGVRTHAHQLKGAGGGYGYPVLSTEAAALEQACKDQDRARIEANLDRVVSLLGRLAM
jgi:HPt (histidine-containing phosphotransfer) domain-containing protein